MYKSTEDVRLNPERTTVPHRLRHSGRILNVAEYNRWKDTDKPAYLKAALIGDADQVLWDSDPKDTSTVKELEALLRRRFSGSIQSDKHRMAI